MGIDHSDWLRHDRKLRRMNLGVNTPAISTVHAVLDRHGLVTRQRRHRPRAQGTPLSQPLQPNDLWCADYKGEFMLADHRYCYPLTVSDSASRFLLARDVLSSTAESFAFVIFERIRPGHPQQNGRHERMHLTLKREATRPAAKNLLQ
jgi:putative transposase